MAGRGTDILLGGNPEFMRASSALAEQVAERLAKGEERFVEDEQFAYFYHLDAFYRVAEGGLSAHLRALRASDATPSTTRWWPWSGLHIVGDRASRARRIDNQLRGARRRQGDPGASRFYLSLEDDLMRIFGSDRISGLMQTLGMEEGVPIEHKMVDQRDRARAKSRSKDRTSPSASISSECDDVMNKQRESISRAAPRDPRRQDPHRRGRTRRFAQDT